MHYSRLSYPDPDYLPPDNDKTIDYRKCYFQPIKRQLYPWFLDDYLVSST